MNLLDVVKTAGDEIICASLSQKPGKFGMTIHNAGFQHLGLKYRYVGCAEDNIERGLQIAREHGVRGVAISMPFKVTALNLMDEVHDTALAAGAVNTVVNDNGWLTGYNTDVAGFSALAEEANLRQDDHICIHGSGGVARAVLVALKDYSDVSIYARNQREAAALGDRYDRPVYHFTHPKREQGVVINCTPVGMQDEVISFIDLDAMTKFIDVIVKETPSVRLVKAAGKPAFTGQTMALHQAFAQFELYTGVKAPTEAMVRALNATSQT